MKRVPFFLWALLCPLLLNASSIYDEIQSLPYDGTGSFKTEASLDKIFKSNEIKTVIEIGSWAGSSTRFLAHRVGPEGKVYAVDHWLGTPEQKQEMNDSHLPYIYQLFLSNIKHFGLTDRVVPVRMTSHEAHLALENVKADLIFIDGPINEQELYQAIVDWHHHLSEGGILCGTEWRRHTVRNAVNKAVDELGLVIEPDANDKIWIVRTNP